MQETQILSLGWEDPLEKEMVTHSFVVFLPGKSHGQRRLAGIQSLVSQESDRIERLNSNREEIIHLHSSCLIYNPLKQYSYLLSLQFSLVAQSCPTLCNPMDCSMPGFPVHHQLLELTQTHVHRVSDAFQPSHPLLSPSPPTFHFPQHQGLFQWVSSLHQVAKVLEFQLQHQSFQWIFRTDFI